MSPSWIRKTKGHGHALALTGLAVVSALLARPVAPAQAEVLRLHGSTTFNRVLLETSRLAIENASRHQLTIVPNKSSNGLIDLLEGRAEMAMISASLEQEIAELSKIKPGLPYSSLVAHDVSRSKVAFAIHPENKVRSVSRSQLAMMLSGEMKSWSELGGSNQPIKPVFVGRAGGVTTVVRSMVLDGKVISAPHAIPVQSPVQVAKVVGQELGALGLTQDKLLAQYKSLGELIANPVLIQELKYVTKGQPTPAMLAVIKATRESAAKQLDTPVN